MAEGHVSTSIGFLDTLPMDKARCLIVHEDGHAVGLDHTIALTSVMVDDAGVGSPPCSNVAHRNLWGSDGGEKLPVGLSGVEWGFGPVVGEVSRP